jgi:hypothetical protein
MSKVSKALLCCALVAGAIASTAPAGADTDTVGDAARELVRLIPADQRYQCFIANPADPTDVGTQIAAAAASITAFVECGPSGAADYIGYAQMTSADAMNGLYLHFANGGSGAGRSPEGNCPSEGTWKLDDVVAGRVACYYSTQGSEGTAIPETVSRVWTDDQDNIISFAVAPHGNIDAVALRKWWLENAGPLDEPVDAPGITSGSASELRRSRAALLAQVPKPIRSSCTAVDPAIERDRAWTAAELSCDAGSSTGVSELYYAAVDPEVIDNVFAFTKPAKGTEDGTCPDSGTFTVGKGKAKHTVGEFACTLIEGGKAQEAFRYTWSDRKRGIVMYAYSADASKLASFVDSGAGDPVDPNAKPKRGS